MKNYDHKNIEKKWQKEWEKAGVNKTGEDPAKKKCYVLDMFPFPSGDGLHVGHPKGYIASDIYARFKKMNGMNVLHPMGWDAFGLPAEQYAMKNKIHPSVAVSKNIARFKQQLSNIGLNYDWEREINTTDPKYYKWTQWIFLKLFEKGLAYEAFEPVNWCPSCQTGLSNEDLDGNTCERCGTVVEKRPMRQWVLRITDYADRLIADLDTLNWPDHVKEAQRNWIGRSEGSELTFKIKDSEKIIKVFTTRADTLFGATYCVLAPEHKLVDELKEKIANWGDVEKYREEIKKKTEIERTAEGKEKTGVKLEGVFAVNPVNQEEVPVFIADYVLAHYGTGAVMAVPAHDERDYAFAKKFGLEIREVVKGGDVSKEAFIGSGKMTNSGKFDGMENVEAIRAITEFAGGKMKVTYRLRDWVFSRQRYWGEPIPVVHCETCGTVALSEKDLPLKLPEVEFYEPSGTGESPLANVLDWVNTKCPKCGGEAKRETNTMPNWAGSSWYWLRYIDPKNTEAFVDKEKEKYWSPVDVYVGGDHATRHLIYARFWHKFLFDIGCVNYPEPFSRLEFLGVILASDGRKMSKRLGNVVNPDDIVELYGADTLRIYEMFMGPFEQSSAWSTESIIGPRRFVEKIWKFAQKTKEIEAPKEIEASYHRMLRKVSEDISAFKFNTAISAMMIFANELEKIPEIPQDMFAGFLKTLAPFIPHAAEELWHEAGNSTFISEESWPKHDEAKAKADTVIIAVQVNGKLRATIDVPVDTHEEEVKKIVLFHRDVKKWVGDTTPKKVIFVKGKLVSIVL